MIIPVPKFNQRDSQWFAEPMGHSPFSLGMQGCTVTSLSMLSFAFGKNLNPKQLCDAMNSDGTCFNTDGTLNWLPTAKVMGIDWGFRWDTTAANEPNHSVVNEDAAKAHVERLSQWGIPTAVWVDENHDGKANHWCCYVGDGMANDPWTGEQVALSTYTHLYGYAIMLSTPVLTGGTVGQMAGKANEISNHRNVDMNANEIIQCVTRP